MLLYISILLSIVVVELWLIVRKLAEDIQFERANRSLLQSISAQVHTRQNRTGMQSGATTDEQSLARLGRISVGRRVVVGGEEDSQLHRDMSVGNTAPEGQDD